MRVWCVRKTEGVCVCLHRGWKRNESGDPAFQVCLDFHACVSFASILSTQPLPCCLHRSPGRIEFQPLSMVVRTKENSCPFENYLSIIDLYFSPFYRLESPCLLFSFQFWLPKLFDVRWPSICAFGHVCALFWILLCICPVINNNSKQSYHLSFTTYSVLYIFSFSPHVKLMM